MASFTAIYDACVLHPAPLRDLLLDTFLSLGLAGTVAALETMQDLL